MIRTVSAIAPRYHGSATATTSTAVRFYAHLAGDRAGVAGRLDVGDLLAPAQLVEIARQHAVAVEVEQPALLGHQETEVLAAGQVGDLADELVLAIVPAVADRHVALVFEVEQLLA